MTNLSKHTFHVNQIVTWNDKMKSNDWWKKCIQTYRTVFGDYLIVENVEELDAIEQVGAGHHQEITVRSISIPAMSDHFSGLWFMPIAATTGFSLDAIDK